MPPSPAVFGREGWSDGRVLAGRGNDGLKDNPFVRITDGGPFWVEVDGKLYNRSAPMSDKPEWKLKSGDEVDKAFAVRLTDFESPAKDGHEGLSLTPGRHKLLVHLFAYPTQPNGPPMVEVVSNEVEFEIPPPASLPEKLRATKEQIKRIELLIKDAPVTTGYLAELFELTPGSKGEYRLRADVVSLPILPAEKSQLDFAPLGVAFYLPAGKDFYVQWDGLVASTLHYYGPFYGNPVKVLGLRAAGATAEWGKAAPMDFASDWYCPATTSRA